MHRTGELYGQFETLDHQKDSATFGMWVFLAQEVLFFGGLFMAYTINRHAFPAAFGAGSNTLDLTLGGFNTVVLILSSLTMAMSVWAAQVGKTKLITWMLLATLVLGCVFLGVKVVEYKQKFDHHLIPGSRFVTSRATLSFPRLLKSPPRKKKKSKKLSKKIPISTLMPSSIFLCTSA